MEIDIKNVESHLSKLIHDLENKKKDEIIISRNGFPIAKLILINNDVTNRIGIAKDEMKDFDISLEKFDSIPIDRFDC